MPAEPADGVSSEPQLLQLWGAATWRQDVFSNSWQFKNPGETLLELKSPFRESRSNLLLQVLWDRSHRDFVASATVLEDRNPACPVISVTLPSGASFGEVHLASWSSTNMKTETHLCQKLSQRNLCPKRALQGCSRQHCLSLLEKQAIDDLNGHW